MRRRASALLFALAAAAAPAQSPPPAAAPAPPKPEARLELPRGPVKITAERADLERREVALYRGNVRLTSADLELSGDRLELRQPARGVFTAVLTGKPARLRHKGAEDLPPVAASAGRIVYDTRTAIVEMSGGAELERGGDTVSSDSIRYDLAARRIRARGAAGNQVQIVIEPPAGLDDGQNTAPQPPAGGQDKGGGDGTRR
jgi:lipopolysaccharide export system protein LptA